MRIQRVVIGGQEKSEKELLAGYRKTAWLTRQMDRSHRKEAGNPNMTTLLPYRGDMEDHREEEESLTGMNIIMKLNSEQIFALLSSYASDKVKLRVVFKDGKINGLRVVPNSDDSDSTSASIAQPKKVEIIKCNTVKETNGTIYHTLGKSDAEEPAYAVNMGVLDYRLNLINYKPSVNQENVSEVAKFSKLVKIVECIASNVGSEGRSNNKGIFYNPRNVVEILIREKQFGNADRSEIKLLMASLRPRGVEHVEEEKEEDLIEWKWFKLVRSFSCTKWMKRLFQEGYRSNDAYTMIYSGRVDPDMVCEKSKEKRETMADSSYVEKTTPTQTPTSAATSFSSSSSAPTSSKSSVISNHSTSSCSRSNSVSTNESRHLSPPPVVVEKPKEVVENAETKKTKRSFKEYRLAKGLNSGTPSTPASPVISTHSPTAAASTVAKPVPAKRRRDVEEPHADGPTKKKTSGGSGDTASVKLPKGPRSRMPETDIKAAELVKTYQGRYSTYYKLYQELKSLDIGEASRDVEKTNRSICRLVDMQNELEMIRWRLGMYSKRMADKFA